MLVIDTASGEPVSFVRIIFVIFLECQMETVKSESKLKRVIGQNPAHHANAEFDLKSFFPYLVRIYYRAVSASVTDIYASLFGLTVSEWRTMAVLGPHRALSAGEIVEHSSMDKVNVSRAIGRLRKRGLLKRDIDGEDRRRAVLRLTEQGREMFNALVPKVTQLEEKILEDLTPDERRMLIELMDKIRQKASALQAGQ